MDKVTAAISAYKKVRNGDPISDEELNSSLPFIKDMSVFLRSDQRLFLAFKEIHEVYTRLEDFKKARKEKL